MWKFIILSLVAAAAADDCWVGDWTEWSQCKPKASCGAFTDYNPVSFSIAEEEWDEGRLWMEYIVKKKTEHFESIQACLSEGSCPEYAQKESISFVPCDSNGWAGEYPCKNVDLLSFTNFVGLGTVTSASGNDIWGWYDADNQREYAIMGMTTGTSFVDVTDPLNPVTKHMLPTRTLNSSWRDIKVIGHHAYIVSEASSHGMQVFDLHQLRTNGPYTSSNYNLFGQAHNIVSNPETNYVYGVGSTRTGSGYRICSGGLHAIDVSEPGSPQFAGCFGTDGYVHDAECVIYRGPHSQYYGREICFCYNENSLTIVDVHDKNDMYMISKKGYTGSAYTHQGWLLDDHTGLLLDDEQDEQRSTNKKTRTYFWDVTNLNDPVLRTTYYAPVDSIDHNQYILGDLSFQANYESGLRVLLIKDNYQLEEVAFFDVFPSRNTANFNGAWSVYPYFPSGNIVVSSINHGLFVLKLDETAVDALRSSTSSGQQSHDREVSGVGCPATSEFRDCDANC